MIKYAIKEFIFEDIRPFNSCHASTLELLQNGDICAAWFGGTKEGAEDVAIWCSVRTNGEWSSPVKVAHQDGTPHWNPVLFKRSDGDIYLYYKVGRRISQWHTMFTYSSDNCQSWKQPQVLVPGDIGGRGPVKNKPIVLKDGTIVAPASIENNYWDAFVDISFDCGESWVKSDLVPLDHYEGDKGIIQPTLWESAPGQVHMMLRSTRSQIYRSDSVDAGKTWSQAYPISLPHNNSGIDVTKLDNGDLVLAYNPVAGKKGPRTPLILSISKDNGIKWEDILILENEEGQYSYPAIISKGSKLFVSYTWKRERIAFWMIEIDQ